jgi:hypothetical protein
MVGSDNKDINALGSPAAAHRDCRERGANTTADVQEPQFTNNGSPAASGPELADPGTSSSKPQHPLLSSKDGIQR